MQVNQAAGVNIFSDRYKPMSQVAMQAISTQLQSISKFTIEEATLAVEAVTDGPLLESEKAVLVEAINAKTEMASLVGMAVEPNARAAPNYSNKT